jgi:hypothetical protein
VEYDAEFLKVSDTLLEKLNPTPFFDNLLLLTRDIQSHIKNEEDKDFKKWAPFRGKEYLCPNCKINHELRDFLRAMLLRFLDKLETDERYSSFLTENEYDSSRNIERGSVPKGTLSLKKIEPKGATESEVLRILSIEKDTNKGKYECLAVDKNRLYVRAVIDTTLVTDELIPDSVVECFTNYVGADTELNILYVDLSKKGSDKIKKIDDMSTFPKMRDLITKIGTIIYEQTKTGEIFTVEGIIIQHKILNSNDNTRDEITSSVLLRDNTGMIPLKLDSKYSNKFHEGDKILAVGAVVNDLLSLTVGDYSSVNRTGGVIITEQNSTYQNEVYLKHLEVNSKLSERMIAVTLINVIFTNYETQVHLSIENESEHDVQLHPNPSDFIAIQNKTQFIGREVLFKEEYFPPIPPGIAENLVVKFEGVDPTESIVSFRFKIWPGIGLEARRYFKFTVQIPH